VSQKGKMDRTINIWGYSRNLWRCRKKPPRSTASAWL